MLEWLAYHLAIGISQIVIYDNESTDDTAQILGRLNHLSWLKYSHWPTLPNRSPQLSAFEHFIDANQSRSDFVALIDLDEFIALPEGCGSVSEYFRLYGLDADGIAAVAVNQRVFGSSGELHYKPTHVIERFQRAAEDEYLENVWFKSFVRPSCVSKVPNPHCVRLKSGRYVNCRNEDLDSTAIAQGRTSAICSGLRINHYIVKSLEEFRIKQHRGGGAGATAEARSQRYSDDFFFGRDAKINKVSWSFPTEVVTKVTAWEESIRSQMQELSSSGGGP
jgi:hypothetical protein